MKARVGFISAQLHRALGSSPAYLNTAVWETLDAFRASFGDPGFHRRLRHLLSKHGVRDDGVGDKAVEQGQVAVPPGKPAAAIS